MNEKDWFLGCVDYGHGCNDEAGGVAVCDDIASDEAAVYGNEVGNVVQELLDEIDLERRTLKTVKQESLSPEELKEFSSAERIERNKQLVYEARAGDSQALDMLIIENEKLIFHVARKINISLESEADKENLLQVGREIMFKIALELSGKYDPEKSAFTTYCGKVFRQQFVLQFVNEKDDLQVFGRRIKSAWRNYVGFCKKFEKEHGREPTEEEIKNSGAGFLRSCKTEKGRQKRLAEIQKIDELARTRQGVLSLDTVLSVEETSRTIHETIACEETQYRQDLWEYSVYAEEVFKAVKNYLQTMPHRSAPKDWEYLLDMMFANPEMPPTSNDFIKKLNMDPEKKKGKNAWHRILTEIKREIAKSSELQELFRDA